MDSEGEPRRLFFEHTTACLLKSSEKAPIGIIGISKPTFLAATTPDAS